MPHVPLQDGTEEADEFVAVAAQADGSILLSGQTYASDSIVVALSADGEELWRWQVNLPWHGSRGTTCFSLLGGSVRGGDFGQYACFDMFSEKTAPCAFFRLIY